MPLRVHGTVRRAPRLAVMGLPLTLETLRVTCVHPELGFFEMDGLRAGIERSLNAHAEELPVIRPRTHVIHVASVAAFVAVAHRLRFVLVIHTIEAAVEVILIIAPRHSRHHAGPIPVIAPGRAPVWQPRINSLHNVTVPA